MPLTDLLGSRMRYQYGDYEFLTLEGLIVAIASARSLTWLFPASVAIALARLAVPAISIQFGLPSYTYALGLGVVLAVGALFWLPKTGARE
ncbi:MAG: hypothetical protein C0497_06375 [Gemmatimonas sp.]|nr:hypothetical protein [Gemmatimonas sp.]